MREADFLYTQRHSYHAEQDIICPTERLILFQVPILVCHSSCTKQIKIVIAETIIYSGIPIYAHLIYSFVSSFSLFPSSLPSFLPPTHLSTCPSTHPSILSSFHSSPSTRLCPARSAIRPQPCPQGAPRTAEDKGHTQRQVKRRGLKR